MLEKLPNRSWNGIKNQAERLGVTRAKRGGKYNALPKGLTCEDWRFMEEDTITLAEIEGKHQT
jgi:hypothetical protein